jgi:hypothetical protein
MEVRGGDGWRRFQASRAGRFMAFGESVPINNSPHLSRRSSMYRYEATSVDGFVQQLAVCYLRHGYWFYTACRIPIRKDPRSVDQKLIQRYGIGISKWARARRKQNGGANLHYLRHDRFFVLLSTHGRHPFFEAEGHVVRDARRSPIRFHGYSISYRGGHPHVRIDQEKYLELRAYFVGIAVHRSADAIARELGNLAFRPYAPIRRQLLCILRAVNLRRKTAGLDLVSSRCFNFEPHSVRPFDPVGDHRDGLAA